jgi:hypothetical protein
MAQEVILVVAGLFHQVETASTELEATSAVVSQFVKLESNEF